MYDDDVMWVNGKLSLVEIYISEYTNVIMMMMMTMVLNTFLAGDDYEDEQHQ